MRSRIIALTTLLLLSGCAHTLSNNCSLIIPPVPVYTPAQQDKMADEIQGGSCPALNDAMKDYSVMRDQARAAK